MRRAGFVHAAEPRGRCDGTAKPRRPLTLAPSEKSFPERLFQAFVFEVLAIALSTLLFAWVMGTGLLDMGILSLANSATAVVWNVIFNAAFDRMRRRLGFPMNVRARVAHAIGFECGMMVVTLPFAMWWLTLGFWPALAFESSALVFFLFYTYAYHWAYDALRDRFLSNRQAPASCATDDGRPPEPEVPA